MGMNKDAELTEYIRMQGESGDLKQPAKTAELHEATIFGWAGRAIFLDLWFPFSFQNKSSYEEILITCPLIRFNLSCGEST